MISQDKFSTIRNERKSKFRIARDSVNGGSSRIYGYNSKIIKKLCGEFNDKVPKFDIEYTPNPFLFQYDLELFIFLNYEELQANELELSTDKEAEFILEAGFTGFQRQEHLLNAMSIRWPSKLLPTGEHSGLLVRNPWLEDYAYAISNYGDTVVFGGAGQGKTYGFLAMMCMIYDYFYYTKSGAQCSYSTVSEMKLKQSTWGYVNKLYPVSETRLPFSLSCGKAHKGNGEYTYCRKNAKDKIIDEGGKFNGVLLPKGIKDARVIDKLTGCHDPIARIYLLDEAQSTDGSPLSAYGNMFLHPKYKWFGMSGNYEVDTDLLAVNVEPNNGWDSVTDKTHIWEGTLKTLIEGKKNASLGRTTCVIHYNNDISPAMDNPDNAKKWPFLPNNKKRDELYKTDELKESYNYKRFWIGYKFAKDGEGSGEVILSKKILSDYGADKSAEDCFISKPITIGSFDSAPGNKDRNIYTLLDVGFGSDGYPMISIKRILQFKKTESQKSYYRETVKQIKKIWDDYEVRRMILDWSSRASMVEMLNEAGIPTDFIIYHSLVPKKDGQINGVTGQPEDRVDLETIKTFISDGGLEKEMTFYADDKVRTRFALGAYVMRMMIEKGRVRGFNESLLNGLQHNSFEKEFCKRTFVTERGGLIGINDKDKFISEYGFSTDILDTIIQGFYLAYVILKIRPHKKTLGLLQTKVSKISVDKHRKLWKIGSGNF